MLCEGATGTESFVHPYPSPPPFANLRRCLQGLLPPTPGKQQRDDDTQCRLCGNASLPPQKDLENGEGEADLPSPSQKSCKCKKKSRETLHPSSLPPFSLPGIRRYREKYDTLPPASQSEVGKKSVLPPGGIAGSEISSSVLNPQKLTRLISASLAPFSFCVSTARERNRLNSDSEASLFKHTSLPAGPGTSFPPSLLTYSFLRQARGVGIRPGVSWRGPPLPSLPRSIACQIQESVLRRFRSSFFHVFPPSAVATPEWHA